MSLATAIATAGAVGAAALAQKAPFGTQEDVQEAEQLWQALVDARLVGSERIRAMSYTGTDPQRLSMRFCSI